MIELLLVISIIALLIAMTLPTLANARKAAHAVQCSSNLRQFMTALNIYATDNPTLPYTNSASGENPSTSDFWGSTTSSTPSPGWLYRGPIDPSQGGDDNYDPQRRQDGALWDYLRTGDVYHCSMDIARNQPTGDARSLTSYVMNRAMNGWNQTLPQRPAWAIDAFKNPSDAVAMWEGDETFSDPETQVQDLSNPNGHWNDGNNDPDSQGPSLRHNEAGSVGFLDGHVEAWSWLRYFDVALRTDETQPNELFCNPGTSHGGLPPSD
ncbi:MAG: DUF1559 domain-containing protein [Planctomycetes bacterium]|nr:DUF1559 domain-containing protein [Planctomycetota bacterium]